MSDDVTIPRETARRMAAWMRQRNYSAAGEWADLLDPPQPSLRDEVAKAIALDTAGYSRPEPSDYSLADAVLALVRKRVLRLPRHKVFQRGWHVRLDDLIALLGGES